MKLSFLNGWIFCVSFFLLSCSSAEGENTSEEKMTSSTKSDSGKGENIASCLGKFDYDYSKLLTSEYVLKHVSLVNSADLEQKYDADAVKRYPEYGEIYYNWPSGRPDVQMNPSFPLKTPDDNSISLTNLSFEEGNLSSIRDRFKTSYKVMSEEEIAEGMARLEKAYKDKPVAELETAKGFLEARGKSSYQPVEEMGDMAYWAPSTTYNFYSGAKLIVLVGNAQFTVTAKVGENNEENFEVAKKIAREVLSKCKG